MAQFASRGFELPLYARIRASDIIAPKTQSSTYPSVHPSCIVMGVGVRITTVDLLNAAKTLLQ